MGKKERHKAKCYLNPSQLLCNITLGPLQIQLNTQQFQENVFLIGTTIMKYNNKKSKVVIPYIENILV